MEIDIVEKKIKQLPDIYISYIDTYVDELLEKTKKINSLRGSFSECADENLRKKEKDAWKNAVCRKYTNG